MWYKVVFTAISLRTTVGLFLNRAIPKKRDLYVLFPYLIMVTVPSKNLSSIILYLQRP